MSIRRVAVTMFHANRPTDGRTDKRRLSVAICRREATDSCFVVAMLTISFATLPGIGYKKNVFSHY
jgi:hypothetical protein